MATTPMSVIPGEIGANQDATQERWSEIFQYALRPGVVRSLTGDPFDSYTTECLLAAKATLAIDVNPGRVWALGHVAVIETLATLAITANSSGQTRYDLVVARFNISASTAEVIVVDGTPGGGPPTPTHTSSVYEVRLGVVQVDNAATATTGKVTDLREFARAFSGPRYGVVNSSGVLQYGDGMSAIATNRQSTGVFRFAPDISWPDTDFTVSVEIEHSGPLDHYISAKNANYVEITVKDSGGTVTNPTRLHCTVNHPRQNILGGT